MENGKKTIAVLVSVVVIVLISYFLYSQYGSRGIFESNESRYNERVLAQTNISATTTPEGRLPEGFPQDVLVEADHIVESYRANYEDPRAVHYSVKFITFADKEHKAEEYVVSMTALGYEVEKSVEDGIHYVYGVSDSQRVSVAIFEEGEMVYVQLNIWNSAE